VLHSLRYRLLLTLVLVVMVAVGTLALFTSQTTTNEFERYVAGDIERNQRLIAAMLSSYVENPDKENLQALTKQAAQAIGDRILVANGLLIVIADSDQKAVGQNLRDVLPAPAEDQVVPAVPVGVFQAETGYGIATYPGKFYPAKVSVPFEQPMFIRMLTGPGGIPTKDDLIVVRVPGATNQLGFLNSVNRSLVLAVLVAGSAAVLLTLLLSRRILGPVEALTAAARKMEKGDLHQRVSVESKDEIGELAHAFNAMADGLARQEQLRRNMVTDVAHELRTPLSNIRGYLEAIKDGVATADQSTIESLHEEAMLLSRLVEDLQELELAEAGQLRLVRQPVSPAEIIERAVSAAQPILQDKGLTLRVDVPASLPMIHADPDRIGQVLRNLLSNAITHTPQGGEISVVARLTYGHVEVSVQDTGRGIPSKHLPHIFERFFRADRSRARATGGAGLGLAIVKQLVELHGGRVWAKSIQGKGSTFAFTLPVKQA
jgi:predicted ribosomally synthesized peptide with SipW-like signal peptide